MNSSQNKLTPDQLLTKMLAFAETPECPPEKKVRLINGAYKTWADSITSINPYPYSEVKKEIVRYYNGSPLFRYVSKNKEKYKRLCQINTENGEVIQTFRTIIEAANLLGIAPILIVNVLKGRVNKSAGFFWEVREFDN